MRLMGKNQVGLSIHRKLAIVFSISSILLVLVGSTSYFYNSIVITLAITSIAVATVMISGFFIYRSITRPIDNIKSMVKEIAKGNFDINMEEDKRNDELGELSRDITQMKNKLKEKDRLKDEFINIASHELRTPIQPILSYIELARRGVIDQQKAFHVVIDQAYRLKRLADEILDVSRIEGNRLVLNKEYFFINEVIAKIVEEGKPTLAKDVEIRFNTARIGGKIIQINADKLRFIQVLANIIGNAIKFTKKGSIEVTIALIDSETAVEISVSDTGGGIPDELFSKLFTKFATKSVASGTEHGTGLGLFISKAIVEAHGGTVAALNNDRVGATFKIVLPVAEKDNTEGSIPSQKLDSSSPTTSTITEKATLIVNEKLGERK